MDPNANLAAQAAIIDTATTRGRFTADDARDLAELRRALSGWIARGGFLPDFARYPEAARRYLQVLANGGGR